MRYERACEEAALRGASDVREHFEARLENSKAVIGMSHDFLCAFVLDDLPYLTYLQQVRAGLRPPAQGDWDRERAAVDAWLFGSYADEIRYAALTLDDQGPPSYGEYSVTLRDEVIGHRASVLEENAFHFVDCHRPTPREAPPVGYQAPWALRARLAVVARADELGHGVLPESFPSLLLQSTGDRSTDRFVEVHIFGAFRRNAVLTARGPSASLNVRQRAKLEAAKDHLEALGAQWVES